MKKTPARPSAVPHPQSTRMAFLREPGAILYWLSNSISTLRVQAICTIMAEQPTLDSDASLEWLLEFFRAEWRALGVEGPERVVPLAHALQTEYSLLAIECMAYALAVQGEDGATELIDLLAHQNINVRCKAAIGLSVLGPSGRWAVPSLVRRLSEEDIGYVAQAIVRALGTIGGARAEEALERLEWRANDALAYVVREALANLRSTPPE